MEEASAVDGRGAGGAAAQPVPEAGRPHVFNEQTVLVQLRAPYLAVGYPAELIVTGSGQTVPTAVLRGILRIFPSGEGGVLLVLQTFAMEDRTASFITLHPDDVQHCTHVERLPE